jgi:hypothetical protein
MAWACSGVHGRLVAIGSAVNPATRTTDFALARYLATDPNLLAGVATSPPDDVSRSSDGNHKRKKHHDDGRATGLLQTP